MSTFNNGAVDNNFASDAEWRAFCVEFDKAVKASGFLIAAPDTGQIDFTTAVRPAVNTYAGYKIYKAADPLAATKPLFVRLDYGVAASNNRPKITIGVATSTDGAGTLTGQQNGSNQMLAPGADGSGNSRIFGGGSESDAWVVHYDGANTPHGVHFHVGRIVDSEDGSAVGPVSFFTYQSSGSGALYSNLYFTDGASSWNSVSPGLLGFVPDLSYLIHSGGDINKTLLYECLVYRNAKTLCFPVVVGRAGELPFTDPDSSSFPLTTFGGSHNFVPLPWSGGISNRACVLWE
jgi:hypothetical protein